MSIRKVPSGKATAGLAGDQEFGARFVLVSSTPFAGPCNVNRAVHR
jgi:hypothetical protein